MGQKINPTGFRLSVSRNWTSRWYANNNDFANMLKEDVEVRNYLKKKLKNASVSKVLIERPAKNARITIFSSRPGVVIGKKGEDIEVLRKELQKRMGVPVHVNIEEIRKPECSVNCGLNYTAVRKTHHVPSRHEARDAKCHASWCARNQNYVIGSFEWCRNCAT